jgi:hypothetical protein
MHFVAMLAYQLPIPVRYELWTTLASMVAAILTSGFALYIVTHGILTWRRLIVSGAVMGAGIGTMHYTGMAAMRLDALVMYNIGPWLLSVVNAIVCFHHRHLARVPQRRERCPEQGAGRPRHGRGDCRHALHWNVRDDLRDDRTHRGGEHGPAVRPLGAAIGAVTLLIMGVTLAVSLQSRRSAATLRDGSTAKRAAGATVGGFRLLPYFSIVSLCFVVAAAVGLSGLYRQAAVADASMVTAAVASILLVLYAVLILIVRHADRIVRGQMEAQHRAEQALQRAHDELEARVRARTLELGAVERHAAWRDCGSATPRSARCTRASSS